MPDNSIDYSSVVSPNVSTTTSTPMSPVAVLVFVVIILAIYLYSAYCLQEIAKKTNTPNPWLAWIPIANIFLMLNIIRQSYWWILAMFVPLVNIGVIFWIWMKIAEVRNRPWWWALLMLISPINLIMLYFLAFKEVGTPVAPISTPTPPATAI